MSRIKDQDQKVLAKAVLDGIDNDLTLSQIGPLLNPPYTPDGVRKIYNRLKNEGKVTPEQQERLRRNSERRRREGHEASFVPLGKGRQAIRNAYGSDKIDRQVRERIKKAQETGEQLQAKDVAQELRVATSTVSRSAKRQGLTPPWQWSRRPKR